MHICDYTGRQPEIEPLLPEMFIIISQNMREITPSGNTMEEDRKSWTQAMREELRNPEKHWILLFSGEALAGYTLYRIENHPGPSDHPSKEGNYLHMDEIQIAKHFQGDGRAFPMLMGKLLEDARAAGAATLFSYANRQNIKSHGILGAMGLQVYEETPRGLRYRGRAEDALAWFKTKYHIE